MMGLEDEWVKESAVILIKEEEKEETASKLTSCVSVCNFNRFSELSVRQAEEQRDSRF